MSYLSNEEYSVLEEHNRTIQDVQTPRAALAQTVPTYGTRLEGFHGLGPPFAPQEGVRFGHEAPRNSLSMNGPTVPIVIGGISTGPNAGSYYDLQTGFLGQAQVPFLLRDPCRLPPFAAAPCASDCKPAPEYTPSHLRAQPQDLKYTTPGNMHSVTYKTHPDGEEVETSHNTPVDQRSGGPATTQMQVEEAFRGFHGGMMDDRDLPLPAQTEAGVFGRVQSLHQAAVQALASFQQASTGLSTAPTNKLIDQWQLARPPHLAVPPDDRILRSQQRLASPWAAPAVAIATAATPLRPPTPPGKKRMTNGHLRTVGYNGELDSAISVTARLPQCEIGAVELLVFFPHQTQWPKAILRLLGNDWTIEDIAKAQLHGRGARSSEGCHRRRATLRQQKLAGGRIQSGIADWTEKKYGGVIAITNYDAAGYTPRPQDAASLYNAKLVHVAGGVVNWPVGQDRGVVTQAIEYAVRNNRTDVTTVDIPRLAQVQGFAMPTEAAGTQWDQLGRVRMLNAIKAAGTYA
ncbi:hypothetical protein LTR36_007336 [Oleoguttula mirabilis]|uniref:Uncharacterized protein n=1 Tax=Oleoguttula mirabilis TaxID=1507867 RepID=A0AAV9JA26_9PEZI|nr:hypothetical protein LTR36_007336 [Oleoguttula mirabilis]